MAWLKRNLALVISGVVALALLGVAGWYLLGKIKEEAAVTEDLDAKTAKFKELNNRTVTPNKENITGAKAEQQKLLEFSTELKKHLAPPDLPKDMNNKDFRALLDNTIMRLQKQAETLGITLPTKDYWFTYQAQKPGVEFKPIEALAAELIDVRDLCEILFKARIHALTGLKRVPVATEDTGYTDYFTDKRATTNDVAIITPYEVTFQGFSSELAKVMEGFVGAERCFIVKTVGVDKAPEAKPTTPPPAAIPTYSPEMMMRDRYGMGGRYGRPMGPPAGAFAPNAKPAPKPFSALLDENKLKFTLQVDSVRLRPVLTAAAAKAAPAAPAAPTSAEAPATPTQ